MGIDINELNEIKVFSLLTKYSGRNPYIYRIKQNREKNKRMALTKTQINYILNYHDKDPVELNRVMEITEYFGEELKKSEHLSFVPKKILVEFLLAETDKAFHIFGKVKQNQTSSKMYWVPKTQLLDDPYYEESDVDIDFDKYVKMDKLNRKPFEHQESGTKFLVSRKGAILGDLMGLGKVISNDKPVLTPDGWVKHGDLKVGNYVVGSSGKPTKVLATHPNDVDDYYNITFTDGSVVESCVDHLWAVRTANDKYSNVGYRTLTIREMLDKSLKKERNGHGHNIDKKYTFKTYYKLPNGDCRWYIPMVNPVEFNNRDIKIDPYVLGCLLGDGSISNTYVGLSSGDEELVNECNKRLPINHTFHFGRKYDYILKENLGNDTYSRKNKIYEILTNYNLMGTKSETKFIPEDYKYNTINIRLEVLQGLLDTDGYCAKDGTIQHYSVSKQLSDDVKEIVQSLGGVARQTSKIGKYRLPNGKIKECQVCYILTINLPEGVVPFKLGRKKDKMKTKRKYLPSRGIKSIEFSRKTKGQCITVDAKDSLYVIDNYTVTHNTYQSIIGALVTGSEKILVVCPASLKYNWKREIECFTDDVTVIEGKKWDTAKFTIINYDILKNFHTLKPKGLASDDFLFESKFVDHGFDLVIVDEAHFLKNPDSQRGKIMNEICNKYGVERTWLLTGTPIANRPMDFFNLLKLIKSPIASNWIHYAKRYCEGRKFFKRLKNGRTKQIWLTDGASNLDELYKRTKNVMLRRLTEDVLDMPDKSIVPVFHEMSKDGWKTYDNLWDEYIIKRRKEGKRVGNLQKDLVELGILRQHMAIENAKNTIEMTENAINEGRKVVIFCNYTEELEHLRQHFGKLCVIHNGSMNSAAKQASVDAFQNNDKIKVFIGNIISAGAGITLTKGTVCIFNSLDWVPGNVMQAIYRCYRIGQDQKVFIYFNIFNNTVDERVWNTLFSKSDIIKEALGDEDENIFNTILTPKEEDLLGGILDEG